MTELKSTPEDLATIEDRVEHINMLTKAVKQSFFEIALQMRAIKDEGGFKTNKAYLTFMEEQTGYKRAAVGQFLRGHEAMGNLIDFAPGGKLPDNEKVLRPLATKQLNNDPELQAEIWTTVAEAAGDGEITAKMVKDAVKARLNPKPNDSAKNRKDPVVEAEEEAKKQENQKVEMESLRLELGWLKKELAEVECERDDWKANSDWMEKELQQLLEENSRMKVDGIKLPGFQSQEILLKGVTNCEAEVIAEMLYNGHRSAVKRFHPDRRGGNEEQMKFVNKLRDFTLP